MRVSLEYAHGNVAALDFKELRRSASAAKVVMNFLQEQGHDVQTVVLIDDKRVDRAEAISRSMGLIDMLTEVGIAPDLCYFERDLMKHLAKFAELVAVKSRRKLERTARAYIQRYDSLPCSLDIAIWHSLRLGLLGPDGEILQADCAISILGEGNEEQEVKARRELLDHFIETEPGPRIVTLFYPERSATPFEPESLLKSLAIALKECELWKAS